MRDPKNGIPLREKSDTMLLATTLRSVTAVGRAVQREHLDAAIGVVGCQAIDDGDIERCRGRRRHSHDDPSLLLFVVTLLSTPVTTADPVGWIVIPPPKLLEAIVFDTKKLLDVLGTILMPVFAKFRMTQFSISRFPPVVNWMPFVPLRSPSMVRPRKWTLSPAPAVIVTPLPEEVPMVAAPTPSLTMLIALGWSPCHSRRGRARRSRRGGGLGEREGERLAGCGARARAAVGSHRKPKSGSVPAARARRKGRRREEPRR
jgi:hypothetical protein